MKNRIYTTEDVAKILKCHPDTVGRHCKALNVKKVKIFIERDVYNIDEDLIEVLRQRIKPKSKSK